MESEFDGTRGAELTVDSIIWVSGGSSGIGQAFLEAARDRPARLVDISRRGNLSVDHLPADLGAPASWPAVERHFEEALRDGPRRALFFHCAGTSAASGPIADVVAAEYSAAAMMNAVAGQVLGRAFLASSLANGIEATLVMCSSPAATNPYAGLSQYCAGKAALEMWTKVAAVEMGDGPGAPRVFSVSPRAVDTPMVRDAMEMPVQALPLSQLFRDADAAGALATPQDTAAQIWAAIDDGVPQGSVVSVGAIDPSER